MIRAMRAAGDPLDPRIERAIVRGSLEWQQTFDAIASPVLVLDASGVVRRLNRAARDLSGLPFPRAVGAGVAALGDGEPWRAAARLVEQAIGERAVVHGQARDAASGRTWDLEASFLAAPDEEGDRVIVVARDLTSLVDLQESLRRSETLSALGALLAGVAHEVRNPLFGITATLDAMRARFRGVDGADRHFDVLRVELQRMKSLMSDLLEFGRPAVAEFRRETLEGVLAEAARWSQPLAAERQVEIAVREADDESARALVRLDRSRLIRLFLNLIENAIHHAPAGTVVLVTRRHDAGALGEFVECEVRDHGPGFAVADLGRVFEPFFTRRAEGIGLGLAIAQRIACEHGATLEVGNGESGGAWVRLRLPIDDGVPAGPA